MYAPSELSLPVTRAIARGQGSTPGGWSRWSAHPLSERISSGGSSDSVGCSFNGGERWPSLRRINTVDATRARARDERRGGDAARRHPGVAHVVTRLSRAPSCAVSELKYGLSRSERGRALHAGGDGGAASASHLSSSSEPLLVRKRLVLGLLIVNLPLSLEVRRGLGSRWRPGGRSACTRLGLARGVSLDYSGPAVSSNF